MSRSRNYVFTLFKGESEDLPKIEEEDAPDYVSFVCWQLEKCPESDRLHYQGYMELSRPQTFVRIKKDWEVFSCARFAVRSGTQAQCITYCEKAETRVEGPFRFGEPKAQGKRSDLLNVKEAIDNKRPLSELRDEFFVPFIRYGAALTEYKKFKTPERVQKTIVILIVGPSGMGKSTFGHRLAHYLGSSVFTVAHAKSSGLYFDGYDSNDVVLLDEMDGCVMRPTFWNGLCDKFPFTVPVHGRSGHQFVSKFLIVVSNYLPKYWWKNRSADQVKQTTRRIDLIFKFVDPFRVPKAPAFGFGGLTISKQVFPDLSNWDY